MFHNLVAKTIYTTKREITDTYILVDFLTTRVREPNKDDWDNLINVMKSIMGTRDITLILSANVSGVLK